MTKYLVSIVFLLTLPLFVSPASAHPADQTYLDLYTHTDAQNQSVPAGELRGTLFLSWAQAALLLEKSEVIASPSAQLLTTKEAVYTPYLIEKLQLNSNNQTCSATLGDIPETPEEEILFGRGLPIPVTYTCPGSNITITNTLFINDFPTQVNIVNVFVNPEKLLKGALLTLQDPSLNISLDPDKLQPETTTTPTSIQSPAYIAKLSQKLIEASGTSLPLAMGIVFLLGLLHTLEAGHSKIIIASLFLDKRATLRHGIAYALVFTVTHIADLILLGVIFLILNSFTDIFTTLPYLQIFSLYALLFLSAYMFLQNLTNIIQRRLQTHHHDHHHDHDHPAPKGSLKQQLVVGFITGLAPCLFGWSIFMVVLTTKQIWLFFPIILSFGTGILAALVLFILLLHNVKKRVFGRLETLGNLSPLLSSILLFAFALKLLLWQ